MTEREHHRDTETQSGKTGSTVDANNPWRVEGRGYVSQTCAGEDRCSMIKSSTDAAWLQRVLAWEPTTTQRTVRLAAERRLRVLAKSALSPDELTMLQALGRVIEQGNGSGEFQYQYFSPELKLADWDFIKRERMLKGLKKRGLVASEGRGKFTFYWITKAGAEARLNAVAARQMDGPARA